MNKVKNILVALDLTDIDVKLIEYTSVIADKLGAEKVYFLHNIKKFELAELFKEQLDKIDIENIIEENIEKLLKRHYTAPIENEILVSEDPDTVSLIRYIVTKFEINLVVLGNKNNINGSGTVSSKLLHSLRCDILSVNREAELPKGNFLATTDFSKFSVTAIQKANAMAQLFGENKIDVLHIFKIPQVYFPYLEPKASLEKAEKHSSAKLDKFIKKNQLENKVNPILKSAGDKSISKQIREIAKEQNTDIIFISGRGQNSFNAFLAGSVCEALFTSKLKRPLWIVRGKKLS
ncbi:universal stress protein [Weeksellaceae bacterium TAE3-ERU29]|nr:universal stress protein [Weeksellaceae bacterium TAE3-ERU29]